MQTTTFEEPYVWVLECSFEPAHEHEFPSDWIFSGPDNSDPRADPRFSPSNFVYLDRSLHPVHTTCSPLCDDQAIDEFTLVADWGLAPVYLQVRRPGERQLEIVPWVYDEETDTVTPFK